MKLEEKKWSELCSNELYAILRFREEVFILEQNCVYTDIDNHDQKALHILGHLEGRLVAYARILPPKELYLEPSIGRVAIVKEERGSKLGSILMEYCLNTIEKSFGQTAIKIMAQYYLVPFYQRLGFETISEKFWEDEIAHFYMLRK